MFSKDPDYPHEVAELEVKPDTADIGADRLVDGVASGREACLEVFRVENDVQGNVSTEH